MITTGLRNGSTKYYIIINMYLCRNRISANFGEANFVEIPKSTKSLKFTAQKKGAIWY